MEKIITEQIKTALGKENNTPYHPTQSMKHPLQRNHTQQILSSREEEEEEEGPTFCERLENKTEDSQHHAEHGREEETETDLDGFIQVERRRRG